ncbi:MAG: Shikimate dehydrogenase (NADP(+)) [Gammaproteobacteria bacterium]|nr:Shikimate dehydrogenase (NADP(+)) [Gammaproteobacteria bacterium]
MTDLFDFNPPPPLYAVMGNPVDHSLSPRIHTMFAQQFGIQLDYRRIHVDAGGFGQAVDGFRATGGQGLNVTVPFKIEAWDLADERTDRSRLAGAANTLSFKNGIIRADNTDGVGMCRDVSRNVRFEVAGKDVLVIGAGGAVRGVLGPLLGKHPANTVIANRSVDKAESLAELFACRGSIKTDGFEQLVGYSFDLVINGTSASLQGELPPLPEGLFNAGALAYDMVYQREHTPFLRWAAEHGAAHLADGLGMLVEQAAESFYVWHGKHPDTGPVVDTFRRGRGES